VCDNSLLALAIIAPIYQKCHIALVDSIISPVDSVKALIVTVSYNYSTCMVIVSYIAPLNSVVAPVKVSYSTC